MDNDLTRVDPQWAWTAYSPTTERPWSRRLAAHLYRRAGFAADSTELDRAVKRGPAETVNLLCEPQESGAEFEAASAVIAGRIGPGVDGQSLAAWWLFRMFNTPDPLLEKLTLFWHGHFATSLAKVTDPLMMLGQNALLRSCARGPFDQMLRRISRDPAMLIYLDSTTNRRTHPNENYARELMELFTLGIGHYTETDIKELARAFTGWEVKVDSFAFDPLEHDFGPKLFLGRAGNFDGDDAVRVILDQPAAPRYIARKLIRFFMFDEPAPPDALVEPIARDLRDGGFVIGPVVHRMLASNLFFSPHSIGRKVRSPVELSVSILRALGGMTSLLRLARGAADLGQELFQPPNVKGWDGGRTWINAGTLLGRANWVGEMLSASDTQFDRAGGSLATAAEHAGAATPARVIDWLLELLVAAPVPEAARAALVELASAKDEGDRSRPIVQSIHAMATMPEFHLS